MDTLELLRDFVKSRLAIPREQIAPESQLEALGVDSLMLLDLMFELEEKFDVRLPEDLPRPSTVAEVIAVFDKLKPAPHD